MIFCNGSFSLEVLFTFGRPPFVSSQNFSTSLNSSSKSELLSSHSMMRAKSSPLFTHLESLSKRSLFEVNNESPASFLAVWTPYVVRVALNSTVAPLPTKASITSISAFVNVTISSITIKVLDKSLVAITLHNCA